MQLWEIDRRLNLFPYYLKYKLNMWYQTPYGRIYQFKNYGILYQGTDVLSFDEWLKFQRAESLIF